MLSDSKVKILELAGKMEIGSVVDYAILMGAKELTAARKRLAELVRDGYMQCFWRDGQKAFYLTQRGLSIIDSSMDRPYHPGGYTSDHTLMVADCAAFMHLILNVSADSILFEREMKHFQTLKPERGFFDQTKTRKHDQNHAPDFVIGDTCYETELTQKSITRLRQNFKQNATNFARQVWFVPERLKALQNRLFALSEEVNSPVEIYTMEQVTNYLKMFDLHNNQIGETIPLQMNASTTAKNGTIEWD